MYYFTEQEIDSMFEKAGVKISDNECEHQENHIAPQVLEYLKDKWENKNTKDDSDLIELGKTLLRNFDD